MFCKGSCLIASFFLKIFLVKKKKAHAHTRIDMHTEPPTTQKKKKKKKKKACALAHRRLNQHLKHLTIIFKQQILLFVLFGFVYFIGIL